MVMSTTFGLGQSYNRLQQYEQDLRNDAYRREMEHRMMEAQRQAANAWTVRNGFAEVQCGPQAPAPNKVLLLL